MTQQPPQQQPSQPPRPEPEPPTGPDPIRPAGELAEPSADSTSPGEAPRRDARVTLRSRIGGLWVVLVAAAVVLVLLLVFVLQNQQRVRISFLAAEGALPLGVALLFAAIAGVLLVAIPGTARILQLRRAARRRRE